MGTTPFGGSARRLSPADPIARAYVEHRRELLARNAPLAVGVFLLVVTGGSLFDWVFLPIHAAALLGLYVVYVVSGIVHLALIRRWPQHAEGLVVLSANTAGAGLNVYAAWIDGNGEMCVLALTILLIGLLLFYPLDLRNQVLCSLGAVIGYPLALLAGVVTGLPAPYSLFALSTAASLTALGAQMLDNYRFEAYRHGARQAALARENAALMEQARAADRAKSEFLATVSHEVRTPLSNILGYTDLLIDGVVHEPRDRIDTLHRVHQQATQLLDMIQSMLDLNRIEAGGLPPQIEAFALGPFIATLRETIPGNWSKDGVRVEWQITQGERLLHTDRSKLEMILRNLIHNALKYTDRGSITISVEPSATHVCFHVIDTGAGIPADDLSRIFDMFRQGSAPPRQGGVGLGLYIAKRLTDALGGEIAVTSVPGAGTDFMVTLPVTVP